MTYRILARTCFPLALTCLASTTSGAQLDSIESQFVQPIGFPTNTPIEIPNVIDEVLVGTFLGGSAGRVGALVLRDDQGVRELVYRDSLIVWNTGDAYTLEGGLYDCAKLIGGGPNGLDGVATVSSNGLRIHGANATDDDFQVIASLPAWTGLERIFAIPSNGGVIELHGYDTPTRVMRRATFDPTAGTLVEGSTYLAPGGLRGMVSVEISDAHTGRELAFWNEIGWLIITNADASIIVSMHDARNEANGLDLVQVLSTTGPEPALLAWKSVDPDSGTERVIFMNSKGLYETHTLGSSSVRSMAAADVDGDGLEDLVLGVSGSGIDDHILVWRRDDPLFAVDSSPDVTTHGHDLIRGDFYLDAQPDKIIATDVDNDSDVDIFVVSGAFGTIDHFLNGEAADLRPTWSHVLNSVTATSTEVSMNGEAVLPTGFQWSADLRLRVQVWPRGGISEEWDMDAVDQSLLPLSSGLGPASVIAAPLVIDTTQTPNWDANQYQLLIYSTLVKVGAGDELLEEYATGVTVFSKGELGFSWVFEKNYLEETGSETVVNSNSTGGESSTSSSGGTGNGMGAPPSSGG